MLTWLSANLIDIVLVAVILLTVGFLVRGLIRDRKAGKRSCGGNCSCCGSCGTCGGCETMKATKVPGSEGKKN